ncbi:MAG: vWA domain-containing protein [Pirellulaceae bacterium]
MDRKEQIDTKTELIQEASLALRALRLRHEAAKYEAEAIELEAILERAKGGDRGELERWLARHRMTMETQGGQERTRRIDTSMPTLDLCDPPSSDIETPPRRRAESGHKGSFQLPESPADDSPWQRMVQAAERRSLLMPRTRHSPPTAELFAPQTDRSPTANSTSIPPCAIATHHQDGSKQDAGLASGRKKESTKPKGPAVESIGGANRSESALPLPSNRSAASGSKKQKGPVETRRVPGAWRKVEADRDQATRTKGLPGWWLSLGLHAVLVPLLALVTYRLAEPPSVGLTASPGHEEPFAFDAPVPMEVDELQVDAEPVESVSSELAVAPELSSVPGLSSELAGEGVPAIAASSRQLGGGATTGLAKRLSGAQFFGSSAEGNTFCFVVDSSGSMRRMGAFEAAKMELMRSIRQLKSNQRYYIFFFSEEVEAMTLQGNVPESLPVYPTPENLERTARWVQRVPIRGGRPPNDALDQAIELSPDAIFLLFDGETKVDVAAHLRQSNRVVDLLLGEQVKVPIHTLGFYTRQYEASLQKIAEENGGSYQYIPPPAGAR